MIFVNAFKSKKYDQESNYNFSFYISLFRYFFNSSIFIYNSDFGQPINFYGNFLPSAYSMLTLLSECYQFLYLHSRSSSSYRRIQTIYSSFLLYFFEISFNAYYFCFAYFYTLNISPLKLSSLSPWTALSLTASLNSFSRSVKSFLNLIFSQNILLLSSLMRSVESLIPISFPYSSSIYFFLARNYAFFS